MDKKMMFSCRLVCGGGDDGGGGGSGLTSGSG